MQKNLTIDESVEATIESILFILGKMGGEVDFHRIFKILYFAERKHLAKYGKSLTGDTYIAMENGPVPSIGYDILKALKGEGLLYPYKDRFIPYFSIKDSYIVVAKTCYDPENLPESVIECLQHSIVEFGNKNFTELTRLSHDKAWGKAKLNNEMDLVEIAKAGGANENMIEYLIDSMENSISTFY